MAGLYVGSWTQAQISTRTAGAETRVRLHRNPVRVAVLDQLLLCVPELRMQLDLVDRRWHYRRRKTHSSSGTQVTLRQSKATAACICD